MILIERLLGWLRMVFQIRNFIYVTTSEVAIIKIISTCDYAYCYWESNAKSGKF